MIGYIGSIRRNAFSYFTFFILFAFSLGVLPWWWKYAFSGDGSFVEFVTGKIGVYGKNMFGKILTCIFPESDILAGLG